MLGDGRVDEPPALRGVGDVGGDGQALPAERFHLLLGLVEAVHPARAEHQVGAGIGQDLGERRTEHRGRAGHDGHPAVEAELVEHAHA